LPASAKLETSDFFTIVPDKNNSLLLKKKESKKEKKTFQQSFNDIEVFFKNLKKNKTENDSLDLELQIMKDFVSFNEYIISKIDTDEQEQDIVELISYEIALFILKFFSLTSNNNLTTKKWFFGDIFSQWFFNTEVLESKIDSFIEKETNTDEIVSNEYEIDIIDSLNQMKIIILTCSELINVISKQTMLQMLELISLILKEKKETFIDADIIKMVFKVITFYLENNETNVTSLTISERINDILIELINDSRYKDIFDVSFRSIYPLLQKASSEKNNKEYETFRKTYSLFVLFVDVLSNNISEPNSEISKRAQFFVGNYKISEILIKMDEFWKNINILAVTNSQDQYKNEEKENDFVKYTMKVISMLSNINNFSTIKWIADIILGFNTVTLVKEIEKKHKQKSNIDKERRTIDIEKFVSTLAIRLDIILRIIVLSLPYQQNRKLVEILFNNIFQVLWSYVSAISVQQALQDVKFTNTIRIFVDKLIHFYNHDSSFSELLSEYNFMNENIVGIMSLIVDSIFYKLSAEDWMEPHHVNDTQILTDFLNSLINSDFSSGFDERFINIIKSAMNFDKDKILIYLQSKNKQDNKVERKKKQYYQKHRKKNAIH